MAPKSRLQLQAERSTCQSLIVALICASADPELQVRGTALHRTALHCTTVWLHVALTCLEMSRAVLRRLKMSRVVVKVSRTAFGVIINCI